MTNVQTLIVLLIAFVCYLAGMLTMRVISRTDALERFVVEFLEERRQEKNGAAL